MTVHRTTSASYDYCITLPLPVM